MILFCNYKIHSVTDDKTKKKKAQGGKRVIFTKHHPAWDAKNRHHLPSEIEMDYSAIAHIFNKVSPVPKVEETPVQTVQQPQNEPQLFPDDKTLQEIQVEALLPTALTDLMVLNNVTTDELVQVAFRRGHFPLDTKIENYPTEYWTGLIIPNWEATLNEISKIRNGE